MKSLPINRCNKCHYFLSTPFPTSDSFERPEYWWCTHLNVEEVEDAAAEKVKKNYQLNKLRKIRGYVEWSDESKIEIPDFCPLKSINHD